MSIANRVNLYTLDVFTTIIDGINVDLIAKEIKDFSGDIPHVKDYTPAHSFYEDRTYPFEKPECAKLIGKIESAVSEIVHKEMEIDSVWTLTLEKYQAVSAHSHKVNNHIYPEEYYSISYYINAPVNSAELIFITNHCSILEKTSSIKPETGMLIVFNSFLTHMTNRHYNDEPRIVISANLSPKNPNLTINPDWSAYKYDRIES